MISTGTGSVIVLDLKGDPAYFHACKEAAKAAGRTFKWFTNKPSCSTYIFNPWRQKSLHSLSLSQLVGFICQSLNLFHGQDYGRSWYSMLTSILSRRTLKRNRPNNRQVKRQRKGKLKLDSLIPKDFPSLLTINL